MKYRVEIREVWISTREVELPKGAPMESIIRLALNAEEVEMELSHTMAYHNHTVKALP